MAPDLQNHNHHKFTRDQNFCTLFESSFTARPFLANNVSVSYQPCFTDSHAGFVPPKTTSNQMSITIMCISMNENFYCQKNALKFCKNKWLMFIKNDSIALLAQNWTAFQNIKAFFPNEIKDLNLINQARHSDECLWYIILRGKRKKNNWNTPK